MSEADRAIAALAKAQEGIGSRFETQNSIDEANAQREKEWKEAYARIGQEPPKREEAVQDGRTLYEKLQDFKQKQEEEWDAKMKLGNQYRGILPEEFEFLNDRAKEKQEAERKIKEDENRELVEYREALAAKHAAESLAAESSKPVAGPSKPSVPRIPPKAVKKDVKSLMKGVVVKKKPKGDNSASATPPPKATPKGAGQVMSALGVRLGDKRTAESADDDPDKRQKVES